MFGGPTDVAPDGVGGFYLAWTDMRGYPGPPAPENRYKNIYAQHWLADGTRDPRWPASGFPVCVDFDIPQFSAYAATDDEGGLLVSWTDLRGAFTGSGQDVYAQKIRSDGTVAPGWPVNGRPVAQSPNTETEGQVVKDGAGGMYVAYRLNFIHAATQHLLADGSVDPAWAPNGVPLPGPNSEDFVLCWDGFRGAVVAVRGGFDGQHHVFAYHLGPDYPTAATVSLASSSATHERVSLVWQGVEIERAWLERRGESEAWVEVVELIADGSGRLTYEDRAIEPGARYAYRLRFDGASGIAYASETWIEVPEVFRLALAGLRPNPSPPGDLVIAFTLAREGAGTLEVVDVTGRRIARRSLEGLAAGPHTLRLDEARSVAAGVYWLRLTHSGQVLTTRGVVLR
ncbi:MAG: T9SS type A sorting domain-containing protein [Candidatus Eisenbacteria bacterium]|uniref:T9SS type A sorting domain-containing protein n=1 Tax=Eiseniibacteriota bacterium TaxID=2212470 RepID=A0A849SDY2_UNCEI|nr:T9SS type A sorting domain-containing protein [Candidatus Eisenbacteria bacterium]